MATQAFVGLLADHGLALTTEEADFHFKGLWNAAMIAKVRSEWDITLPGDFNSRLQAAEQALWETKLQTVPGVAQVIAAVVQSGCALCVAFNSAAPVVRMKLTITGLLPYFHDRIFGADQVSRGKPFPDLFLLAASRMSFAPQHCVVVEDSLPGVQAGVAAGMRVLAYAAANDAARLGSAGGEVFTDMAELPALLGIS